MKNIKNLFLAVFWSFLGVRKSADLEQDAKNLKPQHLIIMAFLLMFSFIIILLTIVHFVVG
jgi:amino acid transporter